MKQELLDQYLINLGLDKSLPIFYEIQENIIQLEYIYNDINEYSWKIKDIYWTSITNWLIFSSKWFIETDPNISRHITNFFFISKWIIDRYLKLFCYLSKFITNDNLQISSDFTKFIKNLSSWLYDKINPQLLLILKKWIKTLILIREIRNSLKSNGFIWYDFRQTENNYNIFITHTIRFNKDNKLFNILETLTEREKTSIEIQDVLLFINDNIYLFKSIWNSLSTSIRHKSDENVSIFNNLQNQTIL